MNLREVPKYAVTPAEALYYPFWVSRDPFSEMRIYLLAINDSPLFTIRDQRKLNVVIEDNLPEQTYSDPKITNPMIPMGSEVRYEPTGAGNSVAAIIQILKDSPVAWLLEAIERGWPEHLLAPCITDELEYALEPEQEDWLKRSITLANSRAHQPRALYRMIANNVPYKEMKLLGDVVAQNLTPIEQSELIAFTKTTIDQFSLPELKSMNLTRIENPNAQADSRSQQMTDLFLKSLPRSA